jgi:hypothetical protein
MTVRGQPDGGAARHRTGATSAGLRYGIRSGTDRQSDDYSCRVRIWSEVSTAMDESTPRPNNAMGVKSASRNDRRDARGGHAVTDALARRTRRQGNDDADAADCGDDLESHAMSAAAAPALPSGKRAQRRTGTPMQHSIGR